MEYDPVCLENVIAWLRLDDFFLALSSKRLNTLVTLSLLHGMGWSVKEPSSSLSSELISSGVKHSSQEVFSDAVMVELFSRAAFLVFSFYKLKKYPFHWMYTICIQPVASIQFNGD